MVSPDEKEWAEDGSGEGRRSAHSDASEVLGPLVPAQRFGFLPQRAQSTERERGTWFRSLDRSMARSDASEVLDRTAGFRSTLYPSARGQAHFRTDRALRVLRSVHLGSESRQGGGCISISRWSPGRTWMVSVQVLIFPSVGAMTRSSSTPGGTRSKRKRRSASRWTV